MSIRVLKEFLKDVIPLISDFLYRSYLYMLGSIFANLVNQPLHLKKIYSYIGIVLWVTVVQKYNLAKARCFGLKIDLIDLMEMEKVYLKENQVPCYQSKR